MFGLIESIMIACTLYFFRHDIANLFTNMEDLTDEVAHVLHFFAFYALLDGNKSVSCGAMRGLAKQGPATIFTIICYYIITAPFEYYFGFYLDLGVTGLWAAQMVASIFHLCFIAYMIYWYYDWNVIAKEANDRILRERELKGSHMTELITNDSLKLHHNEQLL